MNKEINKIISDVPLPKIEPRIYKNKCGCSICGEIVADYNKFRVLKSFKIVCNKCWVDRI